MLNMLSLIKDVASIMAVLISTIALCVSIFSFSRGSEANVFATKLNEGRYGLFYPTSVLYETSVMAFSSKISGIDVDKKFLSVSIKNNSKIVYDKLIAALSLGFANEIIVSEDDRVVLSAVVSSLIDIASSDEHAIESEELYTKQNFLFGLLWIMKTIISKSPEITSSEYSEKINRNYNIIRGVVYREK